jgi:rod shape-determining protein MreC
VVISRQVDTGGGVSLLERGVFALLSPIQTLVGRSLFLVSHAWASYVDLRRVRRENGALRSRVDALEFLLQQQQNEADEAARLRKLLELRASLPMDTVTAEVTSRDGAPWFRSVTVDKGRSEGVQLNAPVLSPTGVVGRVVAVGPRAAKVQLLLDRDCGVAVMLKRTRTTAVVTGQVGFADSGTLELTVKYLPSAADVQQGDVVLTSGLDGIYPKGLEVGRVDSTGGASGLFREAATVRPSADFATLEEVIIARTSPGKPVLTESVR